MIKLHFTFDKTKKAQTLKKKLLKKYKNYSPRLSSAIIVAGGDGFMLNSLKKYIKFKKPFYGINCGSFGFLMNKYAQDNLEKKIKNAKRTIINPLQIISSSKKHKKNLIAVNEVSVFRQSRQTAALKLQVKNKTIIKKLIGDGVLISTPAGSTAYNLSVHGPILSLNSGKLAITPISPFRPRRWKGKIISNKLTIKLTNLDPKKRPVAAVADNIEIRNINSLTVKIKKNINLILLHDPERSLVKRIKIEQTRKNFN
jgi:NAD+ kinase|tara:strand:- start:247 stop:1014 length:768 start_codon:yes stop_codon:yes gene_type:complete